MSQMAGWLGTLTQATRQKIVQSWSRMLNTDHSVASEHFHYGSLLFSENILHHSSPLGQIWVEGSLSGPNNTDADLEQLLREAYQRGPQAIARYSGCFAVALFLHSTQTLYLITDHQNSFPWYYRQDTDTLFFAQQAALLSDNATQADPRWLWYHYADPQCFTTETFSFPINLMPAAHVLCVRAGYLWLHPYKHLPQPGARGSLVKQQQRLMNQLQHYLETVQVNTDQSIWYKNHHGHGDLLYREPFSSLPTLEIRYSPVKEPEDLEYPPADHLHTVTPETLTYLWPSWLRGLSLPPLDPALLTLYCASLEAQKLQRPQLYVPHGGYDLWGIPDLNAPPPASRHWPWEKSSTVSKASETPLHLVSHWFTESVAQTVYAHPCVASYDVQHPAPWHTLYENRLLTGVRCHLPWYDTSWINYAEQLAPDWRTGTTLFYETFASSTAYPLTGPTLPTPPLHHWLQASAYFRSFVLQQLQYISHHHWFQDAFLDQLYTPPTRWPSVIHDQWLFQIVSLALWLQTHPFHTMKPLSSHVTAVEPLLKVP